MKKIFFIFLAIFMGIFCTLLAAEVYLRLFLPQPLYTFEKDLFLESPTFGYHLTPSVKKRHVQPEYEYYVQANSLGFRGEEPNFQAKKRVLVLGDSFGMGQGVVEGKHITALVQEELDPSRQEIDIFNTALSGYTGFNQVKVLDYFTSSYKPDLVIILFYWNDLGPEPPLHVHHGYLVLNKSGPKWFISMKAFLNKHSHLYCLIKYNVNLMRIKKIEDKPSKYPYYTPEQVKGGFEPIKQMQDICQQRGIDFVAVLIPINGIEKGDARFQSSKTFFIDLLKQASIKYVDLEEYLPDHNQEDLVYKIDPHWNADGHAFFSPYFRDLILKDME